MIPPEGLVNNVIPGIENCRVSIVASPKYGASFVQYLITAQPGGGTSRPFGREEGMEVFFYVLEGTGTVRAGGEEHPVGPAITSIPRQEPAWNSAAPARSRCGRSSTSSGISRQKG